MRTRTLIAGLAIAAAGLAACTGSTGGTGGTLDGQTWALTSYAKGGTMTNVPADVLVDATFENGTVSGSGGCNRYTGSYTADGSKLTFGPLGSTQMACVGAASDVESAYFANLAASATYTATAETLTIFDSKGASILVYGVAKPGQLGGVEWHATGINNGKQAVVSVVDGTDPTATYDAAGTVSGNGGCNTFNGPAVVDGTSIAIGPLASTKMACADQAASDQETYYFAALQNATTWEVRGSTLELRDDSGALQVLFEAR
jgi:heat shock protein HslJ